MSGEYIQAETLEDYWNQLREIYESRSSEWKDLTKEEYEAIERSEREDSDNHLNEDRLNDDNDTNVVDYCFYKYLPGRVAAYKITIQHKDGSKKEHYFQITLKENLE
ncbi:MAG: hypothetical protein R3B71_05670 [Candidatus Gracilibacteria bacterium]